MSAKQKTLEIVDPKRARSQLDAACAAVKGAKGGSKAGGKGNAKTSLPNGPTWNP